MLNLYYTVESDWQDYERSPGHESQSLLAFVRSTSVELVLIKSSLGLICLTYSIVSEL